MGIFEEEYPSISSYFRSIILFGKNSASYKFAFAKSILELGKENRDFIRLEELARPFSKEITEHLKLNDRQGTGNSSKFLDACRSFNNSDITEEELVYLTNKYGFVNVLDAFHNVNNQPLPINFFEVMKKGTSKGIILTNDFYQLLDMNHSGNFRYEVESRWRLVETAWSLKISLKLLQVGFDKELNQLFIGNDQIRRIDITSSRDALNGYQKGKCFYCFHDISIVPGSKDLADVDHFFPHMLQGTMDIDINGIWNLVLSCQRCNRGEDGKFARIPALKYLERLHKRNNYLVDSHHPLRETIMNQTGVIERNRQEFLQCVYRHAKQTIVVNWEAVDELAPCF